MQSAILASTKIGLERGLSEILLNLIVVCKCVSVPVVHCSTSPFFGAFLQFSDA